MSTSRTFSSLEPDTLFRVNFPFFEEMQNNLGTIHAIGLTKITLTIKGIRLLVPQLPKYNSIYIPGLAA